MLESHIRVVLLGAAWNGAARHLCMDFVRLSDFISFGCRSSGGILLDPGANF